MTRYPKGGQGRRWTVIELRAIPVDWAGDTLSDGDGLHGDVRVARDGSIGVRWRYAFRWQGKVAWHPLAWFPAETMENIRRARDEARLKVGQGINPNTHRQAERIEKQRALDETVAAASQKAQEELTVQDLYDAWILNGVLRKDGNKELKRSFGRDLLPSIGTKRLSELTDEHLLEALRAVASRGSQRKAVMLLADVSQMLSWADERRPWRRLLVEGNPAKLVDTKLFLTRGYNVKGVRTRVLSVDELRLLRERFLRLEEDYKAAKAGSKYSVPRPPERTTQLAVWICLGTLCRIGETISAEWSHVQLDEKTDTGTWFVPAANTKEEQQDLIVDLSPFAVRRFRELKVLTGSSRYCFPSADGKSPLDPHGIARQLKDRQASMKARRGETPPKGRQENDTLLLHTDADQKAGRPAQKWTAHDMRRTGATMMQELGIELDVIDRCQNHALGGPRVRRSYMHHKYREECAAAWKRLGSHLEQLLPGM